MERKLMLLSSQPNHESQESKVTSTPKGSNTPSYLTSSPSISTISNNASDGGEEEEEEQGASGTSITTATSLMEIISAACASENSELASISTIRGIKWSPFWASLKPEDDDSLFVQLFSKPSECEVLVANWIELYEQNREKAILYLLQFIVHLCGYPKLKLQRIYDFSKANTAEYVIKLMETSKLDDKLEETGKFLFKTPSAFEKNLEDIIAVFTDYLIAQALRYEILFDEFLPNHLFDFLRCCSFSNLYPIRITGVLFTLKVMTSILKLFRRFLNYMEENEESADNSTMLEYKRKFETDISFLYLIYKENCNITDKNCYMINLRCTEEVLFWIQAFPEKFIFKCRCFGYLMRFVTNEKEIVRLAALKVCKKLVSSQELHEHIKKRIELILKIVSGRVNDVSIKVEVAAVSVFNGATKFYSKSINAMYLDTIHSLIYREFFDLGKEAGKFTINFLRNSIKESNLLLPLTKLAFKQDDYAIRMPLLIESCFDIVPEWRDWDKMILTLLNERYSFKLRTDLLQMMKEIMKLHLTKKLTISRQTNTETPRPSEHKQVAEFFIPRFIELVSHFKRDQTCLKLLTEMLTFINIDFCQTLQLDEDFDNISNIYESLFIDSFDFDSFEYVVKFWGSFRNKPGNITNTVENLSKQIVGALVQNLQKLTPEVTENMLRLLKENLMKTALIFAQFDLSQLLKWEDLFQVWDKKLINILKYVVVCCKWYLVWRFRKLIKSMNSNEDGNDIEIVTHRLHMNFKEFVYGCIEMLKLSNSPESLLIFETLCDFYVLIDAELTFKIKRTLNHFNIKINEENAQEDLFEFLTRHVINNSQLSVEERNRYVYGIVSILYTGALAAENFAKILRLYTFKEYEALVEDVLTQLHQYHPTLSLSIMQSLTEDFEGIIAENTMIDIHSPQFKHLKLLARKFASRKILKSQSDILKVVNMTITYGLRAVEKFPFLYCTRYFISLLNSDSKKEAYIFFKANVAEEHKNHDWLLLYAKEFK